jgi:hypothetical protein
MSTFEGEKEVNQDLPGLKVLLMGASGSGKTHSIGTLVESGIEVYYLGLEQGLESLLGFWRDNNKPVPENLHWHIMPQKKEGMKQIKKLFSDAGKLSFQALCKMQDNDRGKNNPLLAIVERIMSFEDQRTGQNLGDLSEKGPECALVIDGLSGFCQAAMDMVVGKTLTKSMPDYGLAQTSFIAFLDEFVSWPIHVIMLSQVMRETDEIQGGLRLFPDTHILGKALTGTLNPKFSDVILTERKGTKFSWNTASSQADTKTRNLELKEGLDPSFKPMITRWKNRQKV